MRFSRFRSSVLGLEPQRRNKSRVTKKKKDDSPKPKKDEEENFKSSGSGIGNIKTENKADATSTAIKTERRSISQLLQPPQPPASMETPAMVKNEPGLANAYSQHQHQQQPLRRPSILSVASPRIKQEKPPAAAVSTTAFNTTSLPMPEPYPFNIVAAGNPTTTATATSSTSSTPYLDSHQHRMHMRLPTPCSDSDGGMPGFLAHSPPPSDFLHHSQHRAHSHSQHHATVGAGSPPLSATTTASSPYDFSQQYCDTTTSTTTTTAGPVTLGLVAAGSPSPWHSQLHHHHHHHGHAHSHHQSQTAAATQGAGAMFLPTFELGNNGGAGGFALDAAAGYHPFCTGGEQHHHHNHSQHHHQQQQIQQLLHQQQGHDEDGHHEVDALGLHVGGGGTSMFRERELELEMGRVGGVTAAGIGGHGKGDWDGDVYEI